MIVMNLRKNILFVCEQPAQSFAFKMPMMQKLTSAFSLLLGCDWNILKPSLAISCKWGLGWPCSETVHLRSSDSVWHAHLVTLLFFLRGYLFKLFVFVPGALRKRTTTWMSCFGSDMLKPSHLLGNFRWEMAGVLDVCTTWGILLNHVEPSWIFLHNQPTARNGVDICWHMMTYWVFYGQPGFAEGGRHLQNCSNLFGAAFTILFSFLSSLDRFHLSRYSSYIVLYWFILFYCVILCYYVFRIFQNDSENLILGFSADLPIGFFGCIICKQAHRSVEARDDPTTSSSLFSILACWELEWTWMNCMDSACLIMCIMWYLLPQMLKQPPLEITWIILNIHESFEII